MSSDDIQSLVSSLLKGSSRSVARLISLAEDDPQSMSSVMQLISPYTGRAFIVGVTGPTGSGKSTLITGLTRKFRAQGYSVGIVAVDPTSPFSGGAFLGDRIRMQDLSTDRDVFIRSMATRGSPGGIAEATLSAVKILDASGKDIVFVEAAGAGQSEVDIIKIVQLTILVLTPGLGDQIQSIKAGIMEIANIFVINRIDLNNVDRLQLEIEMMLNMNREERGWRQPIVRTEAIHDIGIEQLVNSILEYREYLKKSDLLKLQLKKRCREELVDAVHQIMKNFVSEKIVQSQRFDDLVEEVMRKEKDSYSAAEELFNEIIFLEEI